MAIPTGPIAMSTVRADFDALHGAGAATDMIGLAAQYSIATPCSLSTFEGHSLYTPQTFHLNPAIVNSFVNTNGSATVTAGSSVVIDGGGIPPFTYFWSQVSGDPMVTSGTNTSTCTWSISGRPGPAKTSIWTCSVADAINTQVHQNISVTLQINNEI
jgi:hypothetical protein